MSDVNEVLYSNGYSTFPKAPELLEPQHQIVSYLGHSFRWGSPTPLQSVYSTAPSGLSKCDLIHRWRDKRIHTFPSGISPKRNVIT